MWNAQKKQMKTLRLCSAVFFLEKWPTLIIVFHLFFFILFDLVRKICPKLLRPRKRLFGELVCPSLMKVASGIDLKLA